MTEDLTTGPRLEAMGYIEEAGAPWPTWKLYHPTTGQVMVKVRLREIGGFDAMAYDPQGHMDAEMTVNAAGVTAGLVGIAGWASPLHSKPDIWGTPDRTVRT